MGIWFPDEVARFPHQPVNGWGVAATAIGTTFAIAAITTTVATLGLPFVGVNGFASFIAAICSAAVCGWLSDKLDHLGLVYKSKFLNTLSMGLFIGCCTGGVISALGVIAAYAPPAAAAMLQPA